MKRPASTRCRAWPAGSAAGFGLALALSACAPLGGPGDATAPGISVTETQLRERAKENLQLGLQLYERGDYEGAVNRFSASLDHGLLSRSEQSTARKYLAFVHCVSGREAKCSDEFRKAMEIDPGFSLSSAEVGHPVWGPNYRNVRAQLTAEAARTPSGAATAPASAAARLLADGLAKYDAGDFAAANKLLQAALKEGLPDTADRIKAHKHLAFGLCLLQRSTGCRNEFMKIFLIEPGFNLEPAEAQHPSWARIFAAARQRAGASKNERTGK